MIVHVVLMRWKDRVTPPEVERAKAAYLDLASRVPGIVSAYWGRSTDARNAQFDGGVVLVAESASAMAAYHARPEHAALTQMVDAMVLKFASADLAT